MKIDMQAIYESALKEEGASCTVGQGGNGNSITQMAPENMTKLIGAPIVPNRKLKLGENAPYSVKTGLRERILQRKPEGDVPYSVKTGIRQRILERNSVRYDLAPMKGPNPAVETEQTEYEKKRTDMLDKKRSERIKAEKDLYEGDHLDGQVDSFLQEALDLLEDE